VKVLALKMELLAEGRKTEKRRLAESCGIKKKKTMTTLQEVEKAKKKQNLREE